MSGLAAAYKFMFDGDCDNYYHSQVLFASDIILYLTHKREPLPGAPFFISANQSTE